MAKFTYGKTFKKNGRLVCYRYKDGKKDKLVSHASKPKKKPFRGRSSRSTSSRYNKYRSKR
jgi:hypothetical protein